MSAFVGFIVDENGDPIQCYHQAYHYETGNWSDIRQTGADGYYSRDHEDTDWDGNGTPLPTGDNVVVCFWDVGADRSGAKGAYSIIRVVSTSSAVYNNNVQVLPSQPPTCSLSCPNTTINTVVSASTASSDLYQWTFNNITHYHKDTYFGQTIFDHVGIATVEYDFNDGDGYSATNSHTYTVPDDKTIDVLVTNNYGQTATDTITIQVRYNRPTLTFSEDPTSPIFGDTVNVSYVITDPDAQVTNVESYFDGVFKLSDPALTNAYDHLLDTVKPYPYYTDVVWNDFYNIITDRYNDQVILQNIPPEVNLNVVPTGNTYSFNSNATDFEDRLDRVEFVIYISPEYIFEETPAEVTWSQLDTYTITEAPWAASATFYKGGQFKITAQAYDQDGGISTLGESIFGVAITDTGPSADILGGNQFFDWE